MKKMFKIMLIVFFILFISVPKANINAACTSHIQGYVCYHNNSCLSVETGPDEIRWCDEDSVNPD